MGRNNRLLQRRKAQRLTRFSQAEKDAPTCSVIAMWNCLQPHRRHCISNAPRVLGTQGRQQLQRMWRARLNRQFLLDEPWPEIERLLDCAQGFVVGRDTHIAALMAVCSDLSRFGGVGYFTPFDEPTREQSHTMSRSEAKQTDRFKDGFGSISAVAAVLTEVIFGMSLVEASEADKTSFEALNESDKRDARLLSGSAFRRYPPELRPSTHESRFGEKQRELITVLLTIATQEKWCVTDSAGVPQLPPRAFGVTDVRLVRDWFGHSKGPNHLAFAEALTQALQDQGTRTNPTPDLPPLGTATSLAFFLFKQRKPDETVAERNSRWLQVQEAKALHKTRGAQAAAISDIVDVEGAKSATVKRGLQDAQKARNDRSQSESSGTIRVHKNRPATPFDGLMTKGKRSR